MQQFKLQIEAAIGVARPMWQSLGGQLKLQPTRCNANPYKLGTPDAMQHTQQAHKHPSSALKIIETLKPKRNPKFI